MRPATCVLVFAFSFLLRSSAASDKIYFVDDYTEDSNNCQTKSGKAGKCTPIFQCDAFLEMISNNFAQSPGVLANSICGFQGNFPNICCPLSSYKPPDVAWTTVAPRITYRPNDGPQVTPSTSTNMWDSDFLSARVGGLPVPPECGLSNATFTKIVGGVPAEAGSWPWMTAIAYYKENGETQFWCGGSLITERHVLTAAHCVNDLSPYKVRLGEHDFSKKNHRGPNPIDINIKRSFIHPKYNSFSNENDIAVLVLEKPVKFTNSIHPVCLPISSEFQSENYHDFCSIVVGWGRIEYSGPESSVLMQVQLPIVPNDKCKHQYRNIRNAIIDNRVICAGFSDGGKDSCRGDSGGPMVVNYESTSPYYQIGLVSYGFRCAEENFSGVYTRIDRFMPFITSCVNQK